MFKKLKIHLILVNVILLSIVLIMIFSGLYFSLKLAMDKKASLVMNEFAKKEIILSDIEKGLSSCFFIEIDSEENTLNCSPDSNIPNEEIEELKKIVISKGVQEGNISTKNYHLKFLKAPKSYGFIIVFIDYSIESNVLNYLIITSLVIGLISLVLVFIISFYIANKAIIPIRISWEKKKNFISDASHELRTPLAILNSNIEIVLENEEETVKSQIKWLNNIQREISKMTNLVEDLLFLARAGIEQMPIYPFDISKILSQVYESFKPLAEKKDLNLIFNYSPNIVVNGNMGRIQQLINILMDNAIKHTSPGGNIHVDLQIAENTFQLIVKDNGEGIPKDSLYKIFERFYRVNKSSSRNQGGYGIGLSIAKCIVEEHQGKINVFSTVGKGTEFHITIPNKVS
ncbi:ATP-binding protein [Clostridium sp. SHJSY1]|uniref:sensor histidine kinase n=1 Tax=Clostridium sp. SHJSY1 TaxID=2942483 RepID=UPI0028743F37|nr:ATP-binding protein [Clostridium sp. SHJSY1]MDS0525970.1 ATP-binding protein [Clostridium sp. SHJSY1]